MFVLTECQVRLGVHQFLMNALSGVVVETCRERHDVLGDYVSINFVRKVNVRVVLEFFKVRRGEKCQPVPLQSFIGEFVHHLNQPAVKHSDIVRTRLHKMLINLVIGTILERNRYVPSSLKRDLRKSVTSLSLECKALIVG